MRLRFHFKLLLAFLAVLLPVLALLGFDFLSGVRRTQHTILEAQSLTAQAVSAQVAETFDAAIDLGWTLANDPVVQTLDPWRLDAHLQRLKEHNPRYDAIGVYDAEGVNRGWGDPSEPPEPRLRIGDRPYFQKVMATNTPVISQVIELRRPIRTAVLVSVPIRGPEERPVGVVNVVLQTALLEQRYLGSWLQPGQAIFLTDPSGRLAFHTGYPELPYSQSGAFLPFEPLQAALAGTPVQLDQFVSPLSKDASLGAFVPIPKYGWVVGVTTPREVALAPLYGSLRTQLTVFVGILLLSTLMSAVLARMHARPVRQLQSVAQALGRGEMQQRVWISSGDELEELGGAFNEMAARIARREADVARLLERELALSRIGQALVREVELDRIAHVAIEQSLHALGVDAVGLWLARPEQRQLTLAASHGLMPGLRERLHQLSFDEPLLTSQAARREAIQVVENVLSEDTPVLARALALEEGFRGMVSVPLHSRGHLVGVMTCLTYAPRVVSAREREFHATVGQLFAVAIEKARLFQEVREALRLREEFMSAAAHELRTPVTTIHTWAEILERMEPGSLRKQKGLSAIMRSTRRLGRLVEHLLAAVWMAPGLPRLERERFDLRTLVEERIESLSRTTEHPIDFEVSGTCLLNADRQRMGEVVMHLLENALRYSPPEGAIEVRLYGLRGEAVLSVRDHGPGIPLERQPHVFEPLYEPLPPGADGYSGVVGLGLHLSRQIIEAHGGRLWVESTPGEGTTFRFSVPVEEAESPRIARA
ncbi:ATP-binding protein [Hyalangium rubrum]|uniref:histidine kinase n=1 Tax=Hyalangium rubrum TaxID=3103134 RepID=A0ABU5GZ37_9BACT|nr:cache domain-containing protein [Hyalangium sp. s54d21]MDY7225959.1 cache domain-containing protein [Hyalangium sp. s54d21]